MLTDQFINLSCVICLDDNPKFTQSVIIDLKTILDSYDEEEVPLNFRKKLTLIKSVAKLRLERKSSDIILDDILAGGHFQELDSYIKTMAQRKLQPEQIDSAVNKVCQRKQYISLSKDLPKLEEFSQKVKTNSFTDLGETVEHWSNLISNLHSGILDQKRKEARSNIRELDLLEDPYCDVIEQIAVSYSGKNSVSTGFDQLDSYMNGGFEPTRLYIFGGISGDGKSVLLSNFIKNAVEKNENTTGPLSIFPYFTLENLIDETLVRLYCNITDQHLKEVIKKFDDEKKKIEKLLKEWMLDYNSAIYMSYSAPTLTSVADLVSNTDLIKNRYGKRGILRAVYADYLDLLKSGQTFDLHRLEMGQVTIDMKVAAVMQAVPWVTVTQLNRGAYNDKENPTLANMSESIKKVEHSDFVGILKNTEENENEDPERKKAESDFKIIIGKNRSGPKNKVIKLKANFSKFSIYDPNVKSSIPFTEQGEQQIAMESEGGFV